MKHSTSDGTVYQRNGFGPTVVLVHGLGMNRAMWQWQLPSLTDDFDVLTYDLWGHGESSNPPSRPSLRLFSDQLIGLLNEANVTTAGVVGFSIGGMIARRFAYDHPSRLSALAILNSAHDRTQKETQTVQKRADQSRGMGPAAMVDAALERWFSHPFRLNNPKTIALVRGWLEANDPTVYPKIYQVLVEGDAELVDKIQSIECPTLVMTSQNDHGNTPEMTHRMADAIPSARSVILPKLMHMALAEDPDQINGHLLAFLRNTLKI